MATREGRFLGLRNRKRSGLVWAHEEQAVVVDNGDAQAVKPTGGPRKFLLNVESWAKKKTAENSIPSVWIAASR